jgi:hydrogenase maturation factor
VRIVRLLPGDLALANTGTAQEEISVALVEAEVGAVVLVHAKEAIALMAEPASTAEDGGAS